jgi:hypothetical protein
MNTAQYAKTAKKIQDRWSSLTLAEKRQEFRELIRSPYWPFLPEDIQKRIRNLASN